LSINSAVRTGKTKNPLGKQPERVRQKTFLLIALAAFVTRPQAVAQIGAVPMYRLGGKRQWEAMQ
jgi:hypothetical protein